jgi:deoxycytidylate deaminase
MRYRLSAIIFDNKFNIINTGYNRWLLIGHREKIPFKTSIHAEADAIIGTPRQEMYGQNILVFRYNFGLAKPCHCCQNLIDSSGIKNVYFSDGQGGVSKL